MRLQQADRRIELVSFMANLSAFLGGLTIVFDIMRAQLGLWSVPALYLIPFLPGAFVGALVFIFRYSHARLPFLLVGTLVMLGLTWSDSGEILNGMLFTVTIIATMSIGSLFATSDTWWSAARYFIAGALISSLVLYFDFQLGTQSVRLGAVVVDGTRVMEPNLASVMFATATISALTLAFNSRTGNVARVLLLMISVWFVWIILLSGSRGGTATVVAAIVALLLFGTSKWAKVVLSGATAIATVAVFWMLQNGTGLVLLDRFASTGSSNIGGRTEIWRQSARLFLFEWDWPQQLLGAGTGSAPYSLGRFAPQVGWTLSHRTYGLAGEVLRVNTHSGFVEWLLTFGLLGIAIGVFALVHACIRCYLIDRNQLLASGMAFLTVFLITSLTLISFRLVGVGIISGGVGLGYIYSCRHCSIGGLEMGPKRRNYGWTHQ